MICVYTANVLFYYLCVTHIAEGAGVCTQGKIIPTTTQYRGSCSVSCPLRGTQWTGSCNVICRYIPTELSKQWQWVKEGCMPSMCTMWYGGTARMTIKMVRRMTTGSELIVFKPDIPYSMARGRGVGGGGGGHGLKCHTHAITSHNCKILGRIVVVDSALCNQFRFGRYYSTKSSGMDFKIHISLSHAYMYTRHSSMYTDAYHIPDHTQSFHTAYSC